MEENKEKDPTGVSEMSYYCFNEDNLTSSKHLHPRRLKKGLNSYQIRSKFERIRNKFSLNELKFKSKR